MVRLNVFFTVADGNIEPAIELGMELVRASRLDAGNHGYDLLLNADNGRKMMICETWQDEQTLAAHMATEHFKRLVPAIENLCETKLDLQQFTF